MPPSKRPPVDDFIHTISDDEENIFSEEEKDEEQIRPLSRVNGNKRKRDAVKDEATAPKKQKNKRLTSGQESNPTPNEESRAGGDDDGDIDPEFEFSIENPRDRISVGFDGWSFSAMSTTYGTTGNTRSGGIDQIVARRKQASGVDQEQVEELDEDDVDETNDLEDESEDAESISSSHSNDQDEEYPVAIQQEDEDSDELAEPVPHPDDVSDSEQEHDEEAARKRAEFFAPEHSAADSVPLDRTSASFQSMSLSRPILKGLAAVGFASATPIQIKTVPVALLGKDVVGGAVTGSGKTAAFIIPILERLIYRPKKVPATRVAILMPTRELAVQCYNVATKLATYTDISFALTVGGLSLREQEQVLKKRPDVIIATPGRFIDHMRNSSSFAVEDLEILVLDEADRMLEDGFAEELNEILCTIPKSRQTMLFSATMTEDVDKLIRLGLNKPVRLMVDPQHQTVQELTQEFIKLRGGRDEFEEHWRLAYLLQLCTETYTTKTIIFFPRKSLAHRVKVLFALRGIKAAELHGSMSQEQRLTAISSFRDGESTHLLATDLASRGLDIPHVETVINFTVPSSTTIYLHRVGRTARAGEVGVSCTLFSAAKAAKSSGQKGSSTSERTLLRPILRLARKQSAFLRTRTIPKAELEGSAKIVSSLQEEIDAVLVEEKEERLLQQSERDVAKGENLVKHAAEIASRPKRTWFQTEKEKQQAKNKNGNGDSDGRQDGLNTSMKKKKKLSSKDKKKLQDRDARIEGGKSVGRKKKRSERLVKGAHKTQNTHRR